MIVEEFENIINEFESQLKEFERLGRVSAEQSNDVAISLGGEPCINVATPTESALVYINTLALKKMFEMVKDGIQ
jgi:hypothetical protein|tara:strand:- start:1105 stop:1329 length:225 start_codon:yes stop_codon:yes gene_type:complete